MALRFTVHIKRLLLSRSMFLLFMLSIILLQGCKQPEKPIAIATKKPVNFTQNLNATFNDPWLLVACMLYVKVENKELKLNDKASFVKIAQDLQPNLVPKKHIDSLIDAFVADNKTVNFNTMEAGMFLREYVENFDVITDVVFANVQTDSDVAEMKKVEDRILKIPGLTAIYRQYVKPGQNMSTLHDEYLALYLQMAYYLQSQTVPNKIKVIKELL
jgi:hypothetical protein